MMDGSVASLSLGEEIVPYKIHVSSKYLDLTQKKLELTRLPHELTPRPREWENGTSKSEIEPLIDFWLEQYSWRVQESHLNNTLPQFRTAIKIPSSNVPLRIHFIHLVSPHASAIPLLLIPTFPFTNLSLIPLFAPLTDPSSPVSSQPFHLIVPSIPGLGFSDAFATTTALIASTAELFNKLMLRLGYEHYLASSTGSGCESPAYIDYYLARLVGDMFQDNCLGVHLIGPPLEPPRLRREPWMWMKFKIASFFHASIFGYNAEDFTALYESARACRLLKTQQRSVRTNQLTFSTKVELGSVFGAAGMLGLREPNTLAYAFCDSPVGLLSLICSGLRARSLGHKLSSTEIIDVTQLAWLPGPEAGMRFWAAAVKDIQELKSKRRPKSKVAVTVFGTKGGGNDGYTCPAWASGKHDVVFAQRAMGRAGLVAWERTDDVVEGIRGLARAVSRRDDRLMAKPALEKVAFYSGEDIILEEYEDGSEDGHRIHLEIESQDTVVPGDMG